jgi:hypothetical protein
MTAEQSNWLRNNNQNYEPVGQISHHARYARRGVLRADGSFELYGSPERAGDFEVGVRQFVDRRA